MPVVKKNGRNNCVCVNFRDLNKSCPKDEFPLPSVDTLIDHMFSFMDGFNGYNQIKMALEDAPKTTFWNTDRQLFLYGLAIGVKNAGATYQPAMTAIFNDMMHRFVECYIDDLVVKSKDEESHFKDLEKVFERCKRYCL